MNESLVQPATDGGTGLDEGDEDRWTVAVVVAHDQNRRLLTDCLGETYDVVAPRPDESGPATLDEADVLVLDAGAYERGTDWIDAFRDREASVFSPVLLLVPDDSRGIPDVWTHVDDVVSMPVSRAVLRARMGGLLDRRRLSQKVAANERELQRQVERLDEFAGVLSHEMRNPLGIASGWLEQAEATGDPEAFDRIEVAHDRMNDIIEHLLDLAREGSVIGATTAVPLDQVVTESWEAVATQDATLEVGPELAGRTVRADPDRVQEVFTNLFRNAVEHGSTGNQTASQSDDAVEHGGSDVTVSVGLCEADTCLFVADDGPGLGDDAPRLLFAPGYTTTGFGTGFGLAIVEQITDAHGWSIRAENGPNGGARFELWGLEIDEEPGIGPN